MQVFYHLGGLGEAMYYALGAEELFDITSKSEFVETLIGACWRLFGCLEPRPTNLPLSLLSLCFALPSSALCPVSYSLVCVHPSLGVS